MENKELMAEYEFIKELWKFRKKYFEVKDDLEWWKAMLTEAGELDVKYNCPFARKMLTAVILNFSNKNKEQNRGKYHGKDTISTTEPQMC